MQPVESAPPDLIYAGPFARQRRMMIEQHLWQRGIHDSRILQAMMRVPREQFIPQNYQHHAYDDSPVPIGFEQTISQPFIVAKMCDLARIEPGNRVLEVGSGCGYLTAVLLELGVEVVAIELLEQLAHAANERLRGLGYVGYRMFCGDGSLGVPAAAPYQAIIVSAAPIETPPALKPQLADGGRLVIPVGYPEDQVLKVIERAGEHYHEERIFPVRFVPLLRPGEIF